jgi:hypothetical protein
VLGVWRPQATVLSSYIRDSICAGVDRFRWPEANPHASSLLLSEILGKKIPHKIPHTNAYETNQNNSKQHNCLYFQDQINQNIAAKRTGTRS